MSTAAECIWLARELGLRLAVAESLTGGLLCAELVAVPGASAAVSGGVIAYDTELKERLLAVPEALLREHGPVNPSVAAHMAVGVRRACSVSAATPADIGIATTGVAGPDPDPQTGQPAGTVWLGVSSVLGDRTVRVQATGGREEIRRATVRAALAELVGELEALRGGGAARTGAASTLG